MKQTEIENCVLCNKGVAHSRQITFYKITLSRLVLNIGAIQRQTGLEMMLGGHAGLANVMGPDEDMAEVLNTQEALVCDECALTKDLPLAVIDEAITNRDKAAKPKKDEVSE